jgi:hypothetical protein
MKREFPTNGGASSPKRDESRLSGGETQDLAGYGGLAFAILGAKWDPGLLLELNER